METPVRAASCSPPPSSPSSVSSASSGDDSNGDVTATLVGAQAAASRVPPLRRTSPRTLSFTEGVTSEPALPMFRVAGASRRTVYTAGRPPWYDCHGQLVRPFIIGICGGTASGKTTVAQKIIEALDVQWVSLLSMDSFYRVLNRQQHEAASVNQYNFDHPDAFDFELLIHVLERLKLGKKVDIPVYNFVTHKRESSVKTMYGANVVIFEGIMTFYNRHVLELLDMKVFVDTDSDVRLARRLLRDTSSRGRSVAGVIEQYERFVKPSFEHYIAPSMVHADIIVPRGGDNSVAINLIVQHVNTQLQQRGLRVRDKLVRTDCAASAGAADHAQPATLHVLPDTPQIRGLHTFIRDSRVSRDEFIFYSRRLMRLTLEHAASLLAYTPCRVDTPQGISYAGCRRAASRVCGVSILRAGETMEQALTEVFRHVSIGKVLIQTNPDTDNPELYYLRLPRDIKDALVILLDATVATGAAAMMALRVLLEHDVPEDRIIFCSLLMAASGVHNIAYAFPRVRIVTSAVDARVNEKFYVIPGIGNFGDRFFGTEGLVV